jgi:hypothetical protein
MTATQSHCLDRSLLHLQLPLELCFHFDPNLSHETVGMAWVVFLLRLGEGIVSRTVSVRLDFRGSDITLHVAATFRHVMSGESKRRHRLEW